MSFTQPASQALNIIIAKQFTCALSAELCITNQTLICESFNGMRKKVNYDI